MCSEVKKLNWVQYKKFTLHTVVSSDTIQDYLTFAAG